MFTPGIEKIPKSVLKEFFGEADRLKKTAQRIERIALYSEDDKDTMEAIKMIWDRVEGRPKQSIDMDSKVSMDGGVFIGDLKGDMLSNTDNTDNIDDTEDENNKEDSNANND